MTRWLTKKRLFALHGWLGLTLGLPLFIICFSGAFAVVSPEIDRLIHPEMRVNPPADPAATPLPWEALVKRVAEASPGGEVAFIEAPAERDEAWTVTVSYAAKDLRVVYIDPFTGKIQGQATTFNAQSFFRIFHKQLYILAGPAWPHGRVIVCAFSIVLLLSAISGLMFFKGWWKALFRLRFRSGRRIFWSDFHRSAGVWSFLFAILFGITGFWYLTVRLMEDFGIAEHDAMPDIPAEVSAARPALLHRLSLDDLAARAQAAFPDFRIRAVSIGIQPGSLVRFYGESPLALTSATDNEIHLDPYSGEILLLDKVSDTSIGGRLAIASYPLHFGRFGGWGTKILWTVAGLAISGGIFAGSIIWCLRMKREDPGFFRRKRVWAIGSLALNVFIIALAASSTYTFIKAQVTTSTRIPARHSLGSNRVGPWQIEAFRHEASSSSSFRFHGDDANYHAAYAWAGTGERPEGLRPLRGTNQWLIASGTAAEAPLRLEIEAHDGSVYKAAFNPSSPGSATIFPPSAPHPPMILWMVAGGFLFVLLIQCGIWIARVR